MALTVMQRISGNIEFVNFGLTSRFDIRYVHEQRMATWEASSTEPERAREVASTYIINILALWFAHYWYSC